MNWLGNRCGLRRCQGDGSTAMERIEPAQGGAGPGEEICVPVGNLHPTKICLAMAVGI